MKIRLATLALFLLIALLAAPAFQVAAQNPLAGLENAAKEKAAEEALTKVLDDNLPLTLNAKDVYPTVTTLPGGPFSPTPLQLTADQLNQPLPPGDYTVNTLDFCSEYSVHQPGAGVAYVLGPYEGKAAGAIGALIWRGTVQYGIAPQSLQAVSWAIQSGLTYAQMPKSYQAIIDQVIPDFKSEITGDFVVNLETTYNNAAKAAQLPPLDTLLAKMGTSGQLALDAERQRQILTSQSTSDELKQQTLFQGQESGIYTPVKAETGPWTERVKGQVYMKLLIAGGNMASNNVMQIRVMPSPTVNARDAAAGPHLVRAAYGEPQTAPASEGSNTSVAGLMQGTLGYSQGQGAQALGQVPVVSQNASPAPQPAAPPAVAQEPPAPPEPAPAPSGPVQGPPAPPGPVQGPPVPPTTPTTTQPGLICPVGPFPAGTHPNVAFTSYTNEISNQQLYNDFQGLYNAGFQNGKLVQGSFADRMNQIAVIGAPVAVFVVNGDDASYAIFAQKSQKVYQADQATNSTIIVPNPDEFAMTIQRPASLCGGYEVVISEQSLMNGYYDSNAARTNPVTEPIQIPLAYELGTNAYNQVLNPGSLEQMTQQDTNRFIEAEFGQGFPPNSSLDSGSAFYGNIEGQPQHPTHGVLDMLNPSVRGRLDPSDVDPTSSLYTDPTQGAKTQQGQIWIPTS